MIPLSSKVSGNNMRNQFKILAEELHRLWRGDQGQSMIEHALLIGFVTLVTVGMFIGSGKDVKGVWSTANSQLVAANHSAS